MILKTVIKILEDSLNSKKTILEFYKRNILNHSEKKLELQVNILETEVSEIEKAIKILKKG